MLRTMSWGLRRSFVPINKLIKLSYFLEWSPRSSQSWVSYIADVQKRNKAYLTYFEWLKMHEIQKGIQKHRKMSPAESFNSFEFLILGIVHLFQYREPYFYLVSRVLQECGQECYRSVTGVFPECYRKVRKYFPFSRYLSFERSFIKIH